MPSLDDILSLFKKCNHTYTTKMSSGLSGVIGGPVMDVRKTCGRQIGDAIANGCQHADCPAKARLKVLNDF